MKISYISDLHLEVNGLIFIENTDDSDILILAGDIGKISSLLILFLKDVCSKWKHVIYVFGNHEHYSVHGSSKFNLELNLLSNLYFIKNGVKHIKIENIDFICSTLWTTILNEDISSYDIRKYDIRKMRLASFGFENNYNRASGSFISYLFKKNCSEINDILLNLSESKSSDEITIIITHFPPVQECDSPLFTDHTYFHNDIDEVIKDKKVDYYIFGHTHYTIEFEKYGIKFLSNQVGYKDEFLYDFDSKLKLKTLEF